jgi:hypothetical protein
MVFAGDDGVKLTGFRVSKDQGCCVVLLFLNDTAAIERVTARLSAFAKPTGGPALEARAEAGSVGPPSSHWAFRVADLIKHGKRNGEAVEVMASPPSASQSDMLVDGDLSPLVGFSPS